MTRSDSGRYLLACFSVLFIFVIAAMIWRGFDWFLFTLATVGLFVGFGLYRISRRES
jgi:hypothetical protein